MRGKPPRAVRGKTPSFLQRGASGGSELEMELRGSARSDQDEEDLDLGLLDDGGPLGDAELRLSSHALRAEVGERGSIGMAGSGKQWKTLLRTHSEGHPVSASNHESLDYDMIHSELDAKHVQRYTKRKFYGYSGASAGRWILTFFCGVLIGATAFGMSKAIEGIMEWKMTQVSDRICVDNQRTTGGAVDHGQGGVLEAGSGASFEDMGDVFNGFEGSETHACDELTNHTGRISLKVPYPGGVEQTFDSRETACGAAGTKFAKCVWACDRCIYEAASPIYFFVFVNLALALLACLPVILFAKEAAGSGIPEVMGYLNGVHIRKLLRLRTLLAKIWGTVMIVSSGFAVGPEGPLVHTGAIIGSGLTRGHKNCGTKKCTQQVHLFTHFHNDTDRRDFISMGAAAGFAAAFGAPVGGVLFALEEASSFWNAKLMWRLLLCTSLACFTLSILRALTGAEDEEPGAANFQFEPGMLTLNTDAGALRFTSQWELALCGVLGCLCGVLGAMFNKMVVISQGYRPKPADTLSNLQLGETDDEDGERPSLCAAVAKILRQHFYRILEVLLICLLTSAVTYGLPYLGALLDFGCHIDPAQFPDRQGRIHESAIQAGTEDVFSVHYKYTGYEFYCPRITANAAEGGADICAPGGRFGDKGCRQYNDMANIFLTSRENSILSLIENPHQYSIPSLVAVCISFFLLMVISFGAAFPAGIFMPTIVVGCTFGALFGRTAKYLACMLDFGGCVSMGGLDISETGEYNIDDDRVAVQSLIHHAGPYALLGAVGLLGGIQRSSVSLVVIIVEGTGKVDYLLPIILTTVCAKWVGDHLNDGIYHTAMHVKGIPFLENEPGRGLQKLTAKDIMETNVVTIPIQPTVDHLKQILQDRGSRFNGFPVVEEKVVGGETKTVYKGIILLNTLSVLLNRKWWHSKRPDGTLQRERSAGGGFGVKREDSKGDAEAAMDGSMAEGQVSPLATTSSGAAGGGDLTPATRETISKLQEAKHRSNHDKLVEDALESLTAEDLDPSVFVNIQEAMNRAPYHVMEATPAQKVHRLFRTMGLRHLVVTDELNQVTGIITRQDLIKKHQGPDGPSIH